MRKITCAPGKYIQGPGELSRLGESLAEFGKKWVMGVADPFVEKHYGEALIKSCALMGMELELLAFSGELTQAAAQEIAGRLSKRGEGMILGAGGGKALDTAKAAAFYAGVPVAMLPTAASTDAPCSAVSVLYREDGGLDRYLRLMRNPELVLVDTEVIAKAPSRLLSAGMGDALATYYEARACSASGGRTDAGGLPTEAALAAARACREILFSDGLHALKAVEQQTVTLSLERVVEANLYLSGVGFESGGLAAAHAFANALTLAPECRAMHGERVAFGLLVQLVLENAPEEELQKTVSFCRSVGLPTSLFQLSLTEEALLPVAKASCEENQPMKNMPFPVTPEQVADAIRTADRFCEGAAQNKIG